MEYPISAEINLIQEDFIEVEMLENLIDYEEQKKESIKTFIIQTAACLIVGLTFYLVSFIANESLWLVILFFVMFLANFCYKYFYGIKHELNMTLSHLVKADKNGNTFFTNEYGVVNLYSDRCEYLTNENRRYFNYTQINNIKITKRLFIFVIKISNEKQMRGFLYMIIPKRDLKEDQLQSISEICNKLTKEYKLLPWTQNKIFD